MAASRSATGQPYPFVSLVLPAQSAEGEIILLLSDLSDHAKNLQRDPRASLLMDGTLELKEPLTGPRLTLLGEVQVSPDQAGDKALYLARIPRRRCMPASATSGSTASASSKACSSPASAAFIG